MSSPHLPGPNGFIIASKLSFLTILFLWGAQFFPITQERNTIISIKPPVQLLNNSLPLFNNLFVNITNSFQAEPNSFQLILYCEPNSFQVKPNSYQLIPYFEPNSYQLIPYYKPNSFQMLKPNSYQLVPYFEPNSFKAIQNNNSIQELHETPFKNNTSEETVLYLLLRLQETYVDSENRTTRQNETIHNNLERNIIMNQINSFLIFSI